MFLFSLTNLILSSSTRQGGFKILPENIFGTRQIFFYLIDVDFINDNNTHLTLFLCITLLYWKILSLFWRNLGVLYTDLLPFPFLFVLKRVKKKVILTMNWPKMKFEVFKINGGTKFRWKGLFFFFFSNLRLL